MLATFATQQRLFAEAQLESDEEVCTPPDLPTHSLCSVRCWPIGDPGIGLRVRYAVSGIDAASPGVRQRIRVLCRVLTLSTCACDAGADAASARAGGGRRGVGA
eukprot:179977-Rhodomonas_salina.1